jgi:hypothetical protein
MKTGRNDPCHCGSGKKYKKCCLASDLTAEQSKPAKPLGSRSSDREYVDDSSAAEANQQPKLIQRPAIPIPDPEPLDPKMEAINARWTEFENAAEDVRRELFIKTLDEPELMDDEMAFEMLNNLYDSTIASGERDVWDNLVEQLHQRLPDVYETSRKYYLGRQITNAIASQDPEQVKTLAKQMAELAGHDIDCYALVVDQLAYHGMLETLSEASHIAWPLIKESDNIMWGQNTFASWGADCVLFERMEQSGGLNLEDSVLLDEIRYYFEELDPERFAEYAGSMSGQATQTLSLSDFKVSVSRRRDHSDDDDDEGLTSKSRSALSRLLDVFADYARKIENISYTKSKLARENILRYIVERSAGKLEPRQSLFESITNPQRKPKPKPKPPANVLCPDHDTLDRYLAGLLQFMSPQRYQAIATFELIPVWMRFLESQGLLEPELLQSSLSKISKLQGSLLPLFQDDLSDPVLAENLKNWNQNVGTP